MKQPVSALLAASFCACAIPAMGQEASASFVGAHGASVPASYLGTFENMDWHLDLWPDQVFHLLRTPQGGGAPTAVAGRWHATGGALVLGPGAGALTLEVRNAGRLRPEGAPDDASGDLVGESGLDPATLGLPVTGMFTYYADAPTIVHCATGRTYPVMQEAGYLALETAYLNDRPAPAEPLFVTIDGTIAMRAQMEGPDRLSMIVDNFHATWPGEDCMRAEAAPELTGTVWRIRTIAGEDVTWSTREPFLVLDRENARFNASVGCNTMMGAFTTAEGLAFGPAASTMMACPEAVAAHEANLASALAATSRHEIGGRTLRLLDDAGDLTVALEAVYLP